MRRWETDEARDIVLCVVLGAVAVAFAVAGYRDAHGDPPAPDCCVLTCGGAAGPAVAPVPMDEVVDASPADCVVLGAGGECLVPLRRMRETP